MCFEGNVYSMPNIWNALYLGIQPLIDPTEGNALSENAGALTGLTFGGVGDALADQTVEITAINTDGDNALDSNNNTVHDLMSFDIGAGIETHEHDGVAVYNATVTYIDGTTGTISAVIVQDTAGHTFLAPERSDNGDTATLESLPIRSLTLNSLITANANTGVVRHDTDFLTCFAAGTHIATRDGEVPIEHLSVGTQILTRSRGFQPLRWIGQSRVSGMGKHAPIRFRAGSIGNRHDLWLSPQHRVLLTSPHCHLLTGNNEALARASNLINGDGIIREPVERVDYFHLMFDDHEIIWSEGALSESFYPGDKYLSHADDLTLNELYELFPQLKDNNASYKSLEIPTLKAYEAKLIMAGFAPADRERALQ